MITSEKSTNRVHGSIQRSVAAIFITRLSAASRVDGAPSGFLLLIWPANDRAAMGSDAPCPVGTVGPTNPTVVPITVMVRVWFAHSHSPVWADASSPIDSIDAGGCVTWLG